MPATTTHRYPLKFGSDQSVEIPTPNPHGRIIIDLIPAANGRDHFPVIRFEPVGYFTSGLMEHYNVYLCQEIERAQAAVRNEAARRAREAAAAEKEIAA